MSAVGALGLGAAAAAGGAFAQGNSNPNNPTRSEPTMQNPATQYPKPPFEKQTQPWPGLVRDMKPKPDHGETSYKGSGLMHHRHHF